MIVLALDTALPACSVAVLDGERVVARLSEPMSRGHQERLAPMVEEAMAIAGISFSALDRIGVTVGPGSFTGLRVGLAFAKGLALALDIPCVGVGSLPALAASTATTGRVAACIDAKRGQVYLQVFQTGEPLGDGEALALDEAVARLSAQAPLTLVGSGASLLAPRLPGVLVVPLEAADPVALARLAAAVEALQPPQPIYLRAPDARLHGAPA
jgi:tRNA threonylcarbamoyladenosine biosynthesis protein TsaB